MRVPPLHHRLPSLVPVFRGGVPAAPQVGLVRDVTLPDIVPVAEGI